jgi:putative hydroxymethylpyrimidine transport system substrate-binding protein
MHIRVMLEYFYPWTNSAGLYLAREQGWYQAAGLDVEFTVYDPARGDSLAYLDRGEVDFALFPSNRLLVQREQGKPIKGIAAINHRGLEAIQTVKRSGIQRPRNLAGKRLALNPTPRGVAMVRHIVAADGGDPDQIIIVDSGVRELTPEQLDLGAADATFGSYWAWEILMDTAVPQTERIIWPVDTIGAPPYHSYLLGVREQTLQDHPDMVRTFLEATRQGYLLAAQEPHRALPIYERTIPYFAHDLLERSLQQIATTWLHDGNWGVQRAELMEPYAIWLERNNILRDHSVWRRAISNDYL